MTTITPHLLLKAYSAGIFPMAESADDAALYWIDPDERGVFPFESFHVSRRLARTIRQEPYNVQINSNFEAVIEGCAQSGPGRSTTWINDRIRALYSQLFRMGFCHTVECWRGDDLVGGLYGVHIGGAFFGESMFSNERDASKIALTYLVARLKAGGFKLLDTQFITPHLETMGAREIARDEYHELLEEALMAEGNFQLLPEDVSAEGVLQLVSHTS
ncbi:MAG: leucyl/phenylalanyl-tRNA--protein transferase [Hyphomicrobiales bacterium]